MAYNAFILNPLKSLRKSFKPFGQGFLNTLWPVPFLRKTLQDWPSAVGEKKTTRHNYTRQLSFLALAPKAICPIWNPVGQPGLDVEIKEFGLRNLIETVTQFRKAEVEILNKKRESETRKKEQETKSNKNKKLVKQPKEKVSYHLTFI